MQHINHVLLFYKNICTDWKWGDNDDKDKTTVSFSGSKDPS